MIHDLFGIEVVASPLVPPREAWLVQKRRALVNPADMSAEGMERVEVVRIVNLGPEPTP